MADEMMAQVGKYQTTYDKPGVCFDPEDALLEGVYTDELSAHRAKTGWTKTLQDNFLLTAGYDFVVKVKSFPEQKRFILTCEFSTACGRYAFWRLTHSQAPEAQYVIETAHIPRVAARDTRFESPVELTNNEFPPSILNQSMFPNSRTVRDIIDRISRSVKGIKTQK